MLTLEQLKSLHDKAYNRGQDTRDRASDDLVFYWITQWDDGLLNDSQLAYRGEFNIIRKAGRQIMADIHSNPVQVDFEPADPSVDDGAELMDGLYRSSCRNNTSKEAFDNAVNEAIVCGFGAWELVNEYETSRTGERNQVIHRRPIYEACNTVFFDPNASYADKSDADYVSILTRYSQEGYEELVKELTGDDDYEYCANSFKFPNQSYSYPWLSEEQHVWVARFYHRKKVKTKVYTFTDPFGEELVLNDEQVKREEDMLAERNFNLTDTRSYDDWEVTRYIASGEKILETTVVPGRNIPVIPSYGERAFVEGQEHYEGVTRLAKDPQRLRNFQLSYLADIVSRSPRIKPIYLPEQIQGFTSMYEESGSENNYPYLLQNRKSKAGEDLPYGPVGQTPDQPMPSALAASIQITREAIEDVANPGMPQDIADPDISGKAVHALQARVDMQSYVYQSNHKHGMRRDGEVFAGMVPVVYDSPRKVALTLPDGSRKEGNVMESVQNPKTMEYETINDLTSKEFDVFAEVGPSFSSQKEQSKERLSTMINGLPPGDPTRDILMIKYLAMEEGPNMDDVREYARKQLILKGIKKPDTPEEEQMLAEAQQNQQPDAMMVAAQAEEKKANADVMEAQNKQASVQVDQFNAETKRIDSLIKAKQAGVQLQKSQFEIEGVALDNAAKKQSLMSWESFSAPWEQRA